MKNVIILLTILLTIHTCSAQSYMSIFGRDSTRWRIACSNLDQGWSDDLYAGRDTIIDSLGYKIITALYGADFGALHEDTATGRVWWYRELAMDMSLQAGDSFHVAGTQGRYLVRPDSIIVVDSVYYRAGRKHIHFRRTSGMYQAFEDIVFIEGIGPNYTLFWNQTYTICQNMYLICAYRDGVQEPYSNLRFQGDCAPLFTGIDDVVGAAYTVYPIPASSNLYLSERIPDATYTISDITGRTCATTAHGNQIDISMLSSGMYVLRISDKAGLATRRFIKE